MENKGVQYRPNKSLRAKERVREAQRKGEKEDTISFYFLTLRKKFALKPPGQPLVATCDLLLDRQIVSQFGPAVQRGAVIP